MPPLKITIPTSQTVEPTNKSKPYTAYTIRIAHPFPRGTTTLQKRYSDFAALDSALRSQVGSAPPLPLPPKSFLGALTGGLLGSTDIERRRVTLEKYLQTIEEADDGRWRVAKAYREFLELGEDGAKGNGSAGPGSQFGRDRVRDASDWLDKFSEAKRNLQDARLWLTRREQATAATAQHEAGANAKRGLVRAGTLLSALDEGLERLSGKGKSEEWGGDRLGDGEIRRRRDMVTTARKERDGLESVLNSMAVKSLVSGGTGASTPSTSSAAVTTEQKAGLFKGASTNHTTSSRGRVLGGPAKETERTRELDNEGVLQLQKQIIAEQDEDLVDLTTVVRRMRQMGVQINEELVEQNAMLGLLDEDVERVDGKMKIAKKRIEKIR